MPIIRDPYGCRTIAYNLFSSGMLYRGLILGLRPANEVSLLLMLGLRPANDRRRYKVTPPLIGWVET